MRYVQLAAPLFVALALAACNPAAETDPAPSRTPSPITPDAPSAPVVPPDPPLPQSRTSPSADAQQVILFTGPMDLTIRLSTEDNFATAAMTDNSDHTLQMRRVPSRRGVRLEDGEGAMIQFSDGQGSVEFVPGKAIKIEEFRLQ